MGWGLGMGSVSLQCFLLFFFFRRRSLKKKKKKKKIARTSIGHLQDARTDGRAL